jgi:hypothetical protein
MTKSDNYNFENQLLINQKDVENIFFALTTLALGRRKVLFAISTIGKDNVLP